MHYYCSYPVRLGNICSHWKCFHYYYYYLAAQYGLLLIVRMSHVSYMGFVFFWGFYHNAMFMYSENWYFVINIIIICFVFVALYGFSLCAGSVYFWIWLKVESSQAFHFRFPFQAHALRNF